MNVAMNDKDVEKMVKLFPTEDSIQPEERQKYNAVKQAIRDILELATKKQISDDIMLSAIESIIGLYLAYSEHTIEKLRKVLELSVDRRVEMIISLRNGKQ
jgi:hypothetical protein